MSAERLREAARLMRERAEAATPGPWSATRVPEGAVANQHIIERWFTMGCFNGNPRNPTGPAAMSEYEPDAAHIASWHPAVALAVADWLDETAQAIEAHLARQSDPERRFDAIWTAVAEDRNSRAIAVADAYLGEDA